jgi:hypothetical protein
LPGDRRSSSPEEITSAFAEVEVIEDRAAIRRASSWGPPDLTVAQAIAGPLADLHEIRRRQKQDPSFGKLLGQSRIYLRLRDPDANDGIWYSEHDQAGRRIRQVEARPDGTMEATRRGDWPLNPPYDLADPRIASCQISPEEFEEAWRQATGPGSQG